MKNLVVRAWQRFNEVQGGKVFWEVWYAICAGLALGNLINGRFVTACLMALLVTACWQRDVAVFEGAKNARIVAKIEARRQAWTSEREQIRALDMQKGRL